MKKIIQICSSLLFMLCINLQAQILIGSDRPAHEAAVLELESNGNRGLLLPRVSLTSATIWSPPMNGDNPADGMMVFNVSTSEENDLQGKGVYVWMDGKWIRACFGDNSCPLPATPQSISLNPSSPTIEVNTGTFTATALPDLGDPSVRYVWSLPLGLEAVGDDVNSRTITLRGTTVGTYNGSHISVHTMNDCGSSSSISGSSSDVITIQEPSCILPGATGPIQFSSRSLNNGEQLTLSVTAASGAQFYDWIIPAALGGNTTTTDPSIVLTAATGTYNPNSFSVTPRNDCGNGPTTQGTGNNIVVICPVPATPTSITVDAYNIWVGDAFSLAANPSIAGASYNWSFTPAGGIEVISSTENGKNLYVRAIAGGTHTITVKAANICGESGEVSTTITVTGSGTIPDPQPTGCDNGSGFIVNNGVYTGPAQTDNGYAWQQFTPVNGSRLCVTGADDIQNPWNPTYPSWTDANNYCISRGMRLPNLGELYNIRTNEQYGLLARYYWSSTRYNNTTSMNTIAQLPPGKGEFSVQPFPVSNSGKQTFRCVKEM